MRPQSSAIVERLGFFAAAIATLTAPFVIFLALPPFYNGIWVQVEGAMPWLHGMGALGALGCGLMAAAGNPRATAALSHPLVLIPAAIFVLAVVLLPTTAVPALSLFGAPEHGFGALVYLDLAALTAAAFIALANSAWRRVTLVATFAVMASVFALDGLFRQDRSWAPFFFGDYLAFYAVFAFAILGVLARGRRLPLAAAAAVMIVLCLMSANKAAILAIGGALILLPAVMRTKSARGAVYTCTFYTIVAGAAIVMVGSAWQEPYREALLAVRWLGPLANLISDSWASLWSRAMLVVVGAQSLIDHPWRLLVGTGWGHYNEALLANLPIVEGRLHELIGTSRVYWDAIRRVDFHSHNQYFEALLSSGIGGAALVIGYGACVVRYAAADRRKLAFFVVLILTVLQSFWFQMPHTLPVMVLAFVLLTDGVKDVGWANERWGRAATVTCAILATMIMSAAGVAALWASTNVGLALKEIKESAEFAPDSKIEHQFLAGLGEIYDVTLLQNAYVRAVSEPAQDTIKSERADEILKTLLRQSLAVPEPATLRLSISTVNVLSGIVFLLPDYQARFGALDDLYKHRVDQLMRRAPRRADIAIPYFNYLLARNREAEVLTLANLILARQENSAVALWFSGIVLLGNEKTSTAGIRNLRRSLAFGIRNLMPVDLQIVREIEQ